MTKVHKHPLAVSKKKKTERIRKQLDRERNQVIKSLVILCWIGLYDWIDDGFMDNQILFFLTMMAMMLAETWIPFGINNMLMLEKS